MYSLLILFIYCDINIFRYFNIVHRGSMKNKYNLELYKLKAELCKTLAEPRRLIIIQELRDGEKSVSDLQAAMDMPQSLVSHHLAVLKDKGVVQARRDGTNIYYSLTNRKICEACDIMHEVFLQQMKKSNELAKELIG